MQPRGASVALGRVVCRLAMPAVLLLLSSCPNPFTLQLMRQALDHEGPILALTSPTDRGSYTSTVVVQGSATDAEGGRASRLTIQVPEAEIDVVLDLGQDGGFSFSFSTAGISQTIAVILTAADWNGNTVERSITLFNDARGPWVTITEPEDMSYYSSVVRVSGRITDSEGAITTSEVKSASYAVPGTSVAGELTLAGDGTFSIEFPTKNASGVQVIDGPRSIEVTAEDWNLNLTTSSVMVLRPATGSDVASFSVTPENKQVTVVWEPVLHATSYTLHNPRYGEIREGVTSPYVWDGLTNGELYSFQLQARIPEDVAADAWSDLRDVIPLSERTLAPWVREVGYRSITIEWRSIPAATEYVVERRQGDGPWMVRAITAETTLTDAGLARDVASDYRVWVAGHAGEASQHVSATPLRFPPEKAAPAGRLLIGPLAGVAADGGLAAVCRGYGIVVLDVSDPDSPVQVGVYDSIESSYRVAMDGQRAYVAHGFYGLEIVDLSVPTSPLLLGRQPPLTKAYAVAYRDDRCFVGDHSGLRIVDIGPAGAPTGRGTAFAIGVQGVVALPTIVVILSSVGLETVDVSDPDAPTIVGTYPVTGGISLCAADDDLVMVGHEGGLDIVDVSNPATPVKSGGYVTSGTVTGVSRRGDRAYALVQGEGLHVVDISDPADPRLTSLIEELSDAEEIAVSGSRLVTAGQDLRVTDIAVPDNPEALGAASPVWGAVVPYGALAYATQDAGLVVVDIRTPASPRVLGQWSAPGEVAATAISGHHAFVAATSEGLRIVDMSDPALPRAVGWYDTTTPPTGDGGPGGLARDVAVSGALAFVTAEENGLHVLDVSDPTAPAFLARLALGYPALSLALGHDRACVTSSSTGLTVVDLTDPAHPVQRGTCAPGVGGDKVVVAGALAFVAAQYDGLLIVDISDMDSPSVTGTYVADGPVVDVEVFGGYVAITVQGVALEIIDVSTPATPTEVARLSAGSWEARAGVAGSLAYVTDSDGNLVTYRLGGD